MWTVLAVCLDQIIKWRVASTQIHLLIWGDIFNLLYAQNTGGIYGMLPGNNMLFAIVSLLILCFLFYYAWQEKKKDKKKYILWQLVIAGGLSNVIDRIFRGYVVDFIQLKMFGIFNVADAMIVLGIIAIMILEIREIIDERKSNRKSSNEPRSRDETR